MIDDVLAGKVDFAVLEGDSATVMAGLPADLFHACICSPPYYALRDYGTGTWEGGDAGCPHVEQRPVLEDVTSTLGVPAGGGKRRIGNNNSTVVGKRVYRDVCGKCGARRVDQQIGLEQTVAEYLARLVAVFSQVRRVLRPDGLLAVNMGDSYNSGTQCNKWDARSSYNDTLTDNGKKYAGHFPAVAGIQQGACMDIPSQLKSALIADGWLYRGCVVWRKLSPMPASLNGWRWERCRVKVKGCAKGGGRGNKAMLEDGSHHTRHIDEKWLAEWSPCPGCPRCEPNQAPCGRCKATGFVRRDAGDCLECGGKGTVGLVLRRGSWRPTPSWEPVYLFARGMGYFADGEAVRQIGATAYLTPEQYRSKAGNWRYLEGGENASGGYRGEGGLAGAYNPAGANLRDVWDEDDPGEVWRWLSEVGSGALREELARLLPAWHTGDIQDVWDLGPEPLDAQHYAAFPTALPTKFLRFATSERGVCPWCGSPWARVVDKEFVPQQDVSAERNGYRGKGEDAGGDCHVAQSNWVGYPRGAYNTTTLGWKQTCNCTPIDPVSAIVLDPFAGACSTLVAARRLGLRSVGIELSPEYVRIGRKRVAGCLRRSKRVKAAPATMFDALEDA